jgi:hypothetical protein
LGSKCLAKAWGVGVLDMAFVLLLAAAVVGVVVEVEVFIVVS